MFVANQKTIKSRHFSAFTHRVFALRHYEKPEDVTAIKSIKQSGNSKEIKKKEFRKKTF